MNHGKKKEQKTFKNQGQKMGQIKFLCDVTLARKRYFCLNLLKIEVNEVKVILIEF